MSVPAAVVARAWCRVDLAGGTLDIWPLGLLHPGARTVNVAVDLAVRVELRRRQRGFRLLQDANAIEEESAAGLAAHSGGALVGLVLSHLEAPPVEVTVASDSPRGGGLGASSALAVALIAAAERLAGRSGSSAGQRSELARDLEARLMGLPTGRQDHFAALLGGALEILHRPGGEEVRWLDVDLERLGASLIVAYSGESHFSAGNNWRVVRGRLDGVPEVVEAFEGIAATAAALPEALERGDLERVGALMSREWSFRRRLAPEVSTPTVEGLLATAAEGGAWGGKVCGAGGGGCVAVLCPPDRREAVGQRFAERGARVLTARPVAGALEVTVAEDR